MRIDNNSVVSFHYRVATTEGEQVDKSETEPLTYLHGKAQIVPGLEEALAGKQAGDKVKAQVPPEKAYGAHDPHLDLRVPVDAFPADARPRLEPGFRFVAEHPERAGEHVQYTVHAREGEEVLISGNHPLAGQTLIFDVEVVEVRKATDEELAHGHAHGPGGHHHH
jgi:FKBP-type peptidyl-prolyl cis-trans isomerase SlyD